MALLRACNIPCRVHGFTIDKRLQKGAMTGFVYRNAPKSIFHSWVEINFENQWYELEAFILDKTYIKKLQEQNLECTGAFCGYGVAVRISEISLLSLIGTILIFRARESIRILVFMIVQMNC